MEIDVEGLLVMSSREGREPCESRSSVNHDPLSRRLLRGTGLQVTSVCVGGGPLGSMPEMFGEVMYERGTETVRHVLDSPFNFLDTSNGYSDGESERRIGAVLRERGGLPGGFVLATKVDPDPSSGDFSGKRVRRSAEESLERLGLESFQLLHLHDPERVGFETSMAPGGPVEALVKLKETGVAGHIGVTGGPVDVLMEFLRTGVFDVVLTHNRFTLLDRSAEPLIAEAYSRGVGVLNAAVYGGGLLAKGPSRTDRYGYRKASSVTLDKARAIEDVCQRYSVPLRAAALQFSLRDPRISSTIVGTATPTHVDELVELVATKVPEPAWAELEELVAPKSEWLG